MKGRDTFAASEATRIRELLRKVRLAEPGSAQKVIRDQLRAIGFYISDWGHGAGGFTVSDFDELVESGQVTVLDDEAAKPRVGGATQVRTGASSRLRTPSQLESPPAELIAHATEALSGLRLAIEEALAGGVPARPGLYALHAGASTWEVLGLGSPPDGRPLYVGKAATSLVSRDLKTHFATGRTGWSSPRRSLAALLVDELSLVPMPRRPENPEPRKWTHYALEEPGDARLTEWMSAELTLACWPSPQGAELAAIERAVMREWLPPLNLVGVTTPWTQAIRAARSTLADRAKAWARERGLSVG